MKQLTDTYHFIIVDDSKIDLFLIEKVLKITFENCTIKIFDKPDQALAFIKTHQPEHPYTILLDINMPVISGFDFLNIFDSYTEIDKSAYTIYILTSSNNITDIERGKSNKYVTDVLHKPLSKDTLIQL